MSPVIPKNRAKNKFIQRNTFPALDKKVFLVMINPKKVNHRKTGVLALNPAEIKFNSDLVFKPIIRLDRNTIAFGLEIFVRNPVVKSLKWEIGVG